jgi:uncharacterized protein (TIGR02996 family)
MEFPYLDGFYYTGNDLSEYRNRTNSEYLNWIATIRSRSEDRTTRLIFADWLEERGQVERAVFYRQEAEQCICEPYVPMAFVGIVNQCKWATFYNGCPEMSFFEMSKDHITLVIKYGMIDSLITSVGIFSTLKDIISKYHPVTKWTISTLMVDSDANRIQLAMHESYPDLKMFIPNTYELITETDDGARLILADANDVKRIGRTYDAIIRGRRRRRPITPIDGSPRVD